MLLNIALVSIEAIFKYGQYMISRPGLRKNDLRIIQRHQTMRQWDNYPGKVVYFYP